MISSDEQKAQNIRQKLTELFDRPSEEDNKASGLHIQAIADHEHRSLIDDFAASSNSTLKSITDINKSLHASLNGTLSV